MNKVLFSCLSIKNKAMELFSGLTGEKPEFGLACVGTSIYKLNSLTIESFGYIIYVDIVYCYPPPPVTSDHLRAYETTKFKHN